MECHQYRSRRLWLVLGTALTLVILAACGGTSSETSSPRTPAQSGPAPTAEAGALNNVSVGSTVVLDGSQSAAADGADLNYQWAFAYTPAASKTSLSGADSATPTFVPDAPGTYLVQLVVRANGRSSVRDVVAIRVGNRGAPAPAATFDHTGITGNCISCHNGSTAPFKPVAHIASSDRCETCHSTLAWTPVLRVDHNEVLGVCSSCHDGVHARGKPADHPATTQECDACHSSASWERTRARAGTGAPRARGSDDDEGGDDDDDSGAAAGPDDEDDDDDAGGNAEFNHAGITSGCSGCHNNVTAEGKPADHIPSPDTCELCHNPQEWEPAVPTAPVPTPGPTAPPVGNAPSAHIPIPAGALCGTCHNGTVATGKSPTHVATTLDCGGCHTTAAWSPLGSATPSAPPAAPVPVAAPSPTGPGFNHAGISPSQCASCHNGVSATGPSVNHIASTDRCASCHTTSRWAPVAFVDHNQVAGSCSSCHNGTTAAGKPANHPATTAECSQCHFPVAWRPVR